jgi:hypothetical protein
MGQAGIVMELSARPRSSLVTVAGQLDLPGYALLRDGLLKVAADGPAGLIADVNGLAIDEVSPAAVFPLVARRVGDWPGIPFSVVTRQRTHLRAFDRYGAERQLAVHADVETAERHQEPRVRQQAERGFPRRPSAPALARAFLRETVAEWAVPELVYDGTLIVAELVGNVLRHAAAEPVVRLDLCRGLLTIAVLDDEVRPAVLLDRPDTRDPGLGLRIVAQASRAWGSSPRWSGGKVVWAVLASAARPGAGEA